MNVMTPTIQKSPVGQTEIEAAIVDPLNGDNWDKLLDRFPNATAFHTAAWARVLSRTYHHTPFYLTLARGGEVVALLPLMEVRSPFTGSRGVSLPFTDFCEPLIDDPGVVTMMGDKLTELAKERRWKHVELRGGGLDLFPAASKGATFHAHTLSLNSSPADHWDRLESSVRQAVRKATREGVAVDVAADRRAVLEFYRLHSQTRRRHGVPPQPLRFFINIYEEMIVAGRGFVVQARAASRVIASSIFFRFHEHAIYKFGASDGSFQPLRPNNLVMWEAIRRLTESGCRILHFGRTEPGNEGLRRFKLGWRTSEEKIQYLRLGTTASIGRARAQNPISFHHTFFRILPLPLNKLAGAAIYPHLD